MPIKKLISALLTIALNTLPLIASACGPWIPESFVTRNDDVFYAPPRIGFAAELRHVLPQSVPYPAVLNKQEEARNAETDLIDDLKAQGLNADVGLESYRNCRAILTNAKRFFDANQDSYRQLTVRSEAMSALKEMTIPASLPTEFQHYLRGARDYYLGDIENARKHWQRLLELPPDERKYRSTWAMFMLAKTGEGKSVSRQFQQVRELASEGFIDSIGLAAASYGLEARNYLDKSKYIDAINLYLMQWSSGYSNADRSLRTVAGRVFDRVISDEKLRTLAQNPNSRAVLTAYLLTQSDSKRTKQFRQRWLNALPASDAMTIQEAGRFALLEYQLNELESAQKWINYAAPDDALALWVQSKLLLRNGQIDEGRTLLLALTEKMESENPDWQRLDTKHAWAELALLMLKRENFPSAADYFANANKWEDLAYVLERVLTTDELISWIQNNKELKRQKNENLNDDTYQLTARRLMREAQFDVALQFFNEALRSKAEQYIESMKLASNTRLEAAQRAQHYWTAAQITRKYGLELFGSEIAPDFVFMDGQLDLRDIVVERKANQYAPEHQLNSPGWTELKRTKATRIRPQKRFHYRYRAAQLAELAAGLLPNNDENAARIYCIAGSWLKLRDPDAADRFYKQLVVRCPDTELGQAAAKVNWFPKVDLETLKPF
ncbi:hypothetical protein [Rubellicoccus peritrichatus]|uniref:Tetratricopeptide repeat protein n=1 Tax=Rubellicoccus peritrichatus TaxID=3080537 RepID=A0AAQ3L9I3_9BACT|nr:hypothetical protein [Puniceicoccus sp. CR14]WOO39328.1 hypothetical protein RZN69_11950 [Puniceicoccus sp. CR14]